MKNLTAKLMVVASALLLMLNACVKDNTNTASKLGKATLTGYVYIDTNLKNDTIGATNQGYEFVDDGTVIYAKYSSQDLVLNPTGDFYATIIDSAVVKSGIYTLTIPANTKNVHVNLYSNDLRLNQTQADPKAAPISTVYTLPGYSANLSIGTVKIMDIYFSTLAEVK